MSDSLSNQPPTSPMAARMLSQRAIQSIVLLYAALSGLWILLSNRISAELISDPAGLSLLNTLKGWFFVTVTSVLLYRLLRRMQNADVAPAPITAKPMLGTMLLVSTMLLFSGISIVDSVNDVRGRTVLRLQTIDEIKSRRIAEWLQERRRDAEFAQASDYFTAPLRHWRSEHDTASQATLQYRVETWRQNRGYRAISLLNADGSRLWSTAGAPADIEPPMLNAARQSAVDGKVRQIGPYRDRHDHVWLDFIAPLATRYSAPPSMIAVLHIDPQQWLFPMLSDWPVPSETSESVLFRREDKQVVVLNELHLHPHSADLLRLPVTQSTLLAAQLLGGTIHPGEAATGRDYRGVPVLGVAKPIPGSDWYLIAKMDQRELLSDTVRDAAWIILAGVLALVMLGAGIILLRQHQQLDTARQVQQAQAERLYALRLLAAIADHSDDAIYAKDTHGRYLMLNPAAAEMTGKPMDALIGARDDQIFSSEHAATIHTNDQAVISGKCTVKNEQELDTAHGRRYFLTTKGPLYDEHEQVIGLFGVSRDITERRHFEAILQESEARYRQVVDSVHEVIFQIDLEGQCAYLNASWQDVMGSPIEATLNTPLALHVHVDDRPHFFDALTTLIQHRRKQLRLTLRFIHASGAIRWIDAFIRLVESSTGEIIGCSGMLTDITARKTAEASLHQQTEELRQRNAELERFNQASVGRELKMIALKHEVNRLSHALGREQPYQMAYIAVESPDQSPEEPT